MIDREARKIRAGAIGAVGIMTFCLGAWFASVLAICAGVLLVFASVRYGDTD